MKRNSTLDILKGICLIFVVITHFSISVEFRKTYLFYFWIEMAIPLCMLITGYVYAHSFRRRELDSLTQIYNLKNGYILEPIIRYTIPFLMAYVAEFVVLKFIKHRADPSLLALIQEIVCGGVGPGSYYFPVMIQLVFLYPLIYISIYREKTKGLICWCVANVVYEFVQWAYGVEAATYRLLVFRYILLIAFGCYFGLGGKISKAVSCALFVVGVVSCYLNTYQNITLFFIPHWKSTSFLTTLFVIPVFYYLLKIPMKFKLLEIFGKASYNIYLTQMAYYGLKFNSSVISRVSNRIVALGISLAICLSGGVIFYYLETPITKKCVAISKKLLKR